MNFDAAAPFYNAFMRGLGLFRVDAVCAALSPLNGSHVADLGGGTGAYALALAQRGAQVSLVDASASMLARAPSHPALVTQQADLRELPFASGVFDAVILVDVLHHLRAPERILAEALRVLRIGGTLCIGEVPAHGGLRGFLRRIWEYPFCGAVTFFDPEQVRDLLGKEVDFPQPETVCGAFYILKGVKK